ncbi:MAG: RES domain-containing protein [Saprospiraceae bacterium]|nr:RES domain-containing protein [Saprospiraceae bacterium]
MDLTKFPGYSSIFNPKKYERRYKLNFIYELRADLMKEINRDGKEHLDYIPTQVVTEYLKFDFNRRRKNKVEGILYNSSKDNKRCLVLFWDNEECLKNLDLVHLSTDNVDFGI